MPNLVTEAQRIAAAYQPPETGRPSALHDPDTLTELLTQIAAGNRREVACSLAGISTRTLSRWLELGEAGTEPQASFVKALKRAEAQAEAGIVANVIEASKKPQFWAAGMTYLERKYPESWGRRNEDSNGPRIVVQIGVKDSDVQVNLLQAKDDFRPQLSPVTDSESLPVTR